MQSVLGMDLPFLKKEGTLLVLLPPNRLFYVGEIVCYFLRSKRITFSLQIRPKIPGRTEKKGVVKMY